MDYVDSGDSGVRFTPFVREIESERDVVLYGKWIIRAKKADNLRVTNLGTNLSYSIKASYLNFLDCANESVRWFSSASMMWRIRGGARK